MASPSYKLFVDKIGTRYVFFMCEFLSKLKRLSIEHMFFRAKYIAVEGAVVGNQKFEGFVRFLNHCARWNGINRGDIQIFFSLPHSGFGDRLCCWGSGFCIKLCFA